MGVKGNRTKVIVGEPTLTKGIDSVINKAKEVGCISEKGLVDIKKLINTESDLILVESDDLDSTISGMLSKDKKLDKWILTVNAKHHPKRQRFTMAHEYAHYILHKDDRGTFVDEEIYFRKENNHSIEYNADLFASELLMPEENFINAIRVDGIKTIKELSDRFNVSAMAIELRAKKLKEKGV